MKSNKNKYERLNKQDKKDIINDSSISNHNTVLSESMIDLMKSFIKTYEENKESEKKYVVIQNENISLINKLDTMQNELIVKNNLIDDSKIHDSQFRICEENSLKLLESLENEKEINKKLNDQNCDSMTKIDNFKLEIEKLNEIKTDNQSQIVKLKKEIESTLKHNTIVEDLTIRLQSTINTIQIEFKEKYTLLISEKLKAEDLLDHFRKEFIILNSNKR